MQDFTTKKVVAEGVGESGLYKLKITASSTVTPLHSVNATSSVNVHQIHQRFGHISWTKLRHVPSFNNIDTSLLCDTCKLSKFHRLPFPSKGHKSAVLFELIHTDIWGPYQHSNLDGSSYFLTIVEDSTRCTWTYLRQSKSQVPTFLETFFHYVHTHFNTSVKNLRSDNGSEYLSTTCSNLLQSRGISHQLSMTYTLQQNGVVERKHRHLLDTARSLKIYANLPGSFWGECILTATYLVNRMPSPILEITF